MGRKRKISLEDLCKLFKEKDEGVSSGILSRKYNLSRSKINYFYSRYLINGPESLKPEDRNRAYSIDFKKEIIKKYLSGESINSINIKQSISYSVVFNWIKLYNKGIIKKYQRS